MTTFLGERAPAAFPTFPMATFDMTEALRAPFAWQVPIWDFYAAAMRTNLEIWSAAFAMRPVSVDKTLADAQKALGQPLETMAAVAAPTLAEVQTAAVAPVKAAVEAVEAVTTDLPVRTETAGEPEPAMVGGEAAPISPVAAAAPKPAPLKPVAPKTAPKPEA